MHACSGQGCLLSTTGLHTWCQVSSSSLRVKYVQRQLNHLRVNCNTTVFNTRPAESAHNLHIRFDLFCKSYIWSEQVHAVREWRIMLQCSKHCRYGGPDSQQVVKTFDAGSTRNNWLRYLGSSENVVVASLDGAGASLRGENYRFKMYRKLGTVEIWDHLEGGKYVCEHECRT